MRRGEGELEKRLKEHLGQDAKLVYPLVKSGFGFYFTVGTLLCCIALAIFAYFMQFRYGLGVTGMNRPMYWGIYIINFIFFIGISHAGTLISAILRVTQAEWRRPITRSAEVITVMVIAFGAINVIIDLGRPDRILNIISHGRFQSPLLWDVVSISTYLTASSIYLYIPMIPDLAILRDILPEEMKVRRWFYRKLSLGYKGTERQKMILEKIISILAVIVIPIAVSVHTVIAWIFGMTIQPMWHSTIFGPYFVVGAIYSGIASIMLAMSIIRKVYHLENYLKPVHYNNLGKLLVAMTCIWLYFTFAEYLTAFYGSEPHEMHVFWDKFKGAYMLPFWAMFSTCFIIPFVILSRKKTRTITGINIASISILIGMWLERYIIIVPTVANPRLPIEKGFYFPTWVEWSIFLGILCGFLLVYVLFTKLFPIISIWEIKEGREQSIQEVKEKVETYLPDEVY